MKILAINNQPTNSKPNFKGNLIGKLPDELSKYSNEFNTYAKKAFSSISSDVILTEGTAKAGKFLSTKVNFPNCYSQNSIMVSAVESFNNLKKYVDDIKNEAEGLISAHKKCGYIK